MSCIICPPISITAYEKHDLVDGTHRAFRCSSFRTKFVRLQNIHNVVVNNVFIFCLEQL